MSLGSRLRKAREAKGLTLSDISVRASLPENYVSAVETGGIDPDAEQLAALVGALGGPDFSGAQRTGAVQDFRNLQERLSSDDIALGQEHQQGSTWAYTLKRRFRICLRNFIRLFV
jgi:transcriptional regulator with XRE-family HTH domain